MELQGKRTFLARPFWRDYVVAYLMIGTGFMLTSPTVKLHIAVGLCIVVGGVAILLCAIGWSLASTWKQRGDR